ncbi:host cell division inhibitor Icd-like protein [Escherichia coli]|nr:host cell division inhibitor Icd-like protein [Escherichia coli]
MTGKTKATAKGRQWVLRQIKLERIANNATFAAGGQCDQCAGLLVGCQPLGSIPRLSNSRRKSLLIHPDRLSSPSSFMAILKRSNKSASRRSCTENLSFLLSLVDMVNLCSDNAIKVTMYTNDTTKTTPRSGGTHAGRLTTNDNESIEVAMLNHTTHPQGRDSHNLNKYIWRFIALSTAQPRVIHIEATSEQEARQQSPDGCVMVFAARIRQEVSHA